LLTKFRSRLFYLVGSKKLREGKQLVERLRNIHTKEPCLVVRVCAAASALQHTSPRANAPTQNCYLIGNGACRKSFMTEQKAKPVAPGADWKSNKIKWNLSTG